MECWRRWRCSWTNSLKVCTAWCHTPRQACLFLDESVLTRRGGKGGGGLGVRKGVERILPTS